MTDSRSDMHEPRSRCARRAPSARRTGPIPRRAGLFLSLSALALGLTGCQGGTGILRRWAATKDQGIARPITADEVGDTRTNMIARWLNPQKAAQTAGGYTAHLSMGANSAKADPETDREIQAAEALFQQGKLAEAETALAALEKKKDRSAIPLNEQGLEVPEKKTDLWSRVKGGQAFTKYKKIQPAWGERILYFLGESQYQQGKFYAANDTFERLLNQYPGGSHRDKAIQREFAIAEAWFAAGEDARKAGKAPPAPDLPADGAKLADASAPKEDDDVRPASWKDHFNGRLPLLDVDGYALRAMEHVRNHDATGPLADIATLRIADHYMARQDYENASVHYDELLEMFPKSKLVQRAQLGSIEAKIKGYLGPEYDASGLDKARLLIKQTLTAFPDRPKETTDKLYHYLDLISDQQAEIAFKNGEFYKRTGYVGGAEFYFGEVQARWPKSSWAEKAKTEMASLAKAPRRAVLPSKILTLPGAPDPNAIGNSMGSMATMPGGGFGGGGPAGSGP